MRDLKIIILLLTLGVTGCDNTTKAPPTPLPITPTLPTTTTSTGIGRFQIVFNPQMRADTFLIDTQKGRIWQQTQFSDLPGKPSAWEEMDVLDDTGEIGTTHMQFLKDNTSK
ncbi:hypothetical protein [Sulfuriferula nivalis]|uniref:Uncharacterized protein n=1 Tax=Sulfuriferula nivalis TaxID=2675298 RepID=A0A809SBS9_9PROT|nr:hypothetical protein [Sulfuriferula nivalis]BBO99406.1 hypothetical protein SFSGTM_01150 [Sulfuriferula nivalis]